MMILRVLLVCSLTAVLAGCFRPEDRTISVSVPQMKSQACADLIVAAFRLGRPDVVEGVKAVTPNLDKQVVVVTFSGRNIGIKNVQHTIAAAGFDADELKGDAKVRSALPEGCR